MDLPAKLPPRWRDSMRLRRACLLHYQCERSLTARQAESVALELIEDNGEGRWHCMVVPLDASGRDWEFRFKPRLATATRPRIRTLD